MIAYREWADKAREACTGDPTQKLDGNLFLGLHFYSHHPMPGSWSKEKKKALAGQIMRQKPDKDNVEKALVDALFDKDERLSMNSGVQFWALESEEPRVEVILLPIFPCAYL